MNHHLVSTRRTPSAIIWWCNFTLIEMLVVIAIIAVLAAMMMPALNSAIESSVSTQCLSSQKQVYFLITSYSDNNNGVQPGNYIDVPTSVSSNGQILWYKGLYDYLDTESKSIFLCPAFKRRGAYSEMSPIWVNYSLMKYRDASSAGGMKSLRAFSHSRTPSRTAQLFDCGYFKTSTSWSTGKKLYYVNPAELIEHPSNPNSSMGDYRHGAFTTGPGYYGRPRYYDGTSDVLYLDGHAKPIRYDFSSQVLYDLQHLK